MADTLRLTWPLQFDARTGHLKAAEQGSGDDLVSCVEAVLRTRIGDRMEHPEFGTFDLRFQQLPVDLDTVVAHVARWEPRARLLAEQDPSKFAELLARLNIRVASEVI